MSGRRLDVDRTKLHHVRGHLDNQKRRNLAHNPAAQKDLVELTADMVAMPSHYKSGMAKEFNRARDLIVSLEIATAGDSIAVSVLCTLLAELAQVNFLISKDDYIIEYVDRHGEVKTKLNPLLPERARLLNSIKPFLTEFGLTPNSRRRILQANPDKPETESDAEWDDLLN